MSTEGPDSLDFDELFKNCCAELVTSTRDDVFPRALLRDHAAGEWVLVAEFCTSLKIEASDDLPFNELPWLYVTWLPEPSGLHADSLILFFDMENIGSFPALVNRQYFLRD